MADGVIQCSFLRNIHIPTPNKGRFDLDLMHYLFMAHGRTENGINPICYFLYKENSILFPLETVCCTWVIFHHVSLKLLRSSVYCRENPQTWSPAPYFCKASSYYRSSRGSEWLSCSLTHQISRWVWIKCADLWMHLIQTTSAKWLDLTKCFCIYSCVYAHWLDDNSQHWSNYSQIL